MGCEDGWELSPFFSIPSVVHCRQRGRIEMRDRTGVLKRANAFDALLTADAGRLHAPERRPEIEAGGTMVVDPDVATD